MLRRYRAIEAEHAEADAWFSAVAAVHNREQNDRKALLSAIEYQLRNIAEALLATALGLLAAIPSVLGGFELLELFSPSRRSSSATRAKRTAICAACA